MWRLLLLALFSVVAVKASEFFRVVGLQAGSDHATIQEAIDAVPADNAERKIILIRAGDYFGNVRLNKPFVTLRGEGPATRLHFNLGQALPGADGQAVGWQGAAALHITPSGNDAAVETLCLENTYGKGMQAQACAVEGDRVVFRRCLLLGWQDTVRLETGRQWFDQCFISGHVDFIYGGATALFTGCEIHCRDQGYIVAPATPVGRDGFVFERCRITFPYGNPPVYLGRPWRESPMTTFVDCEMGAGVRAEGWKEWRVSTDQVRFAEFGSTGPGAPAGQRVSWATTESAVPSNFSARRILGDWQPE